MVISPNKWELDVQGYLNTCNITSATPRQQIRDFAAGVNDLGLWNSMVCWPLRSSQNAGTGTTAFSLGGLGTFNGTLVNGPTWGADGVDFVAASSQRISTAAVLEVVSAGAVFNSTNNSADQVVINSRNAGSWTSGINLAQRWIINSATVNVAGASGRIDATAANLYGSYCFLQGTYTANGSSTTTDTSVRLNKNSATTGAYGLGSGNMAAQTTALIIAGEGPAGTGRPFNGTISFAFVQTIRLSGASQESFYDLYKQTLGTGLGLP